MNLPKNHMQYIYEGFNCNLSKYENFIYLGDFNAEMSNTHIQDLSAVFNLV